MLVFNFISRMGEGGADPALRDVTVTGRGRLCVTCRYMQGGRVVKMALSNGWMFPYS